MKRVFYILTGLLLISMSSFPQIAPKDSCRADFKWKVNEEIRLFAPGMAINFYDASEANTESWFWDFGDGSYSEEQNPLHIYTFLYGTSDGVSYSGEFIPEVCLSIKTKDGCKSDVCRKLEFFHDTTIVKTDTGCFVYFYPYINDTIISIPEVSQYSFKVSAPENTVSWLWDFNDGTVSTESDPVHGFDFLNNLSEYNVCLTILTSDSCSASYCTQIYPGFSDSLISPDCQASYIYSVMESEPQQFAFQDFSMGNPAEWFWDFGDGSFSNEQNPVHIFGKLRDSLDASGYLGPPVADHYKVCLTVVDDSNCKSTYCDYVYMGGVIDTIYPQPCPYFISITTSNILGGGFCNGTATASLVDSEGNSVEAIDFYWSTGETGSSASGLCVNVPNYVSITGMDGCQLAGSFAILDYTRPIDPFGYWTIYGNGSNYELNYAVPDSGYLCKWEFSDGTTLTGETVNYDFDEPTGKYVTLNVLDDSGRVVYSEEIALNQAIKVEETEAAVANLYPNPADKEVHIRLNKTLNGNVSVEIYNAMGQKQISRSYNNVYGSSEISVPVIELGHGLYYARVLGVESKPVVLRFVK